MGAATTHLVTVEEFRKLREDRGPVYHELHHGEIVTLTRPKWKHSLIQHNLLDLLRGAGGKGYVALEVAFRPKPEHELWVADVACLSAEQFHETDPEDNLRGAPEIVIDVLSPSNTASEILDKEQICLANGSREFWVVDPRRQVIKVTTSDHPAVVWQAGQEIPLPLFGPTAKIKVDEIFRY